MRLSASLLLVVSSVLIASAAAATRPHYGGAVRVAMPAAISSLDPLDDSTSDRQNLTILLFDTLVVMDNRGRIESALALSWQNDPGDQRWTFRLRPGISFHDGAPLTSDAVAASLRAANPVWKIYASGDLITIETSSPTPYLLAQLAESHNAVAKRSGTAAVGTGPFRINSWEPGRRLFLSANDNYWNGRPFLDSIQIDLGMSSRDQLIAFELGKLDIAQLLPEQAHRAISEGYSAINSSPSELYALSFAQEAQSSEELDAREALSLSINRSSMCSALLQGFCEPAASLLPNWMTGYAFLIQPDFNLAAARDKHPTRKWTIGYDPSDPMARVLAERVVLNAQDAGMALRTSTSGASDLKLIHITLSSADPYVALLSLQESLDLPLPSQPLKSEEDFYHAEITMLQTHRLIPLLFTNEIRVLNPAVHGWSQTPLGVWHPADLWLETKTP